MTEKKMTQEVVKVTGPCQLFFGLFDLWEEDPVWTSKILRGYYGIVFTKPQGINLVVLDMHCKYFQPHLERLLF